MRPFGLRATPALVPAAMPSCPNARARTSRSPSPLDAASQVDAAVEARVHPLAVGPGERRHWHFFAVEPDGPDARCRSVSASRWLRCRGRRRRRRRCRRGSCSAATARPRRSRSFPIRAPAVRSHLGELPPVQPIRDRSGQAESQADEDDGDATQKRPEGASPRRRAECVAGGQECGGVVSAHCRALEMGRELE